MYTIHVYATYQGVTESKSTQFRIATGGPYKVYIDCPSSSYVGQDLGCTVIIQDEGEAATESITTVWVDINNNGVNDTGEPRMSFSKRTEPFQTVTQPITLNIPSNHPLGLFMIQADTEYVGSVQPNSKASDTVLFSVASPSNGTGTTGGGGGTGAGGGEAIAPITPQTPQTTVNTNDGGGRDNKLNLTNAQVYLSGDIVCNKPYIRKGTECCLDLNTNAICDYDERTPSQYPNPEENKRIMQLFTDEKLYLTILAIGLCFLVLLIFLIFLLLPNYIKRMRKALVVDKDNRNDELDKDRYTAGYRDAYNTYSGSNKQIYGSIIRDKERDNQEMQVGKESLVKDTVDKNIKVEEEIKSNISEIESRLKEENKAVEPKIEQPVEKEIKIEEIKTPKNNPEPVLNIKREIHQIKEVYGDKRFFLNDGIHISNLNQLVSMLENMDVETFNRHVNDQKNDFYNWIYHALDEKTLALKIRNIRNKKEMADIIREYILIE
jgi:hypothetical protein